MAGALQDGAELTESHEINVTPFIDVVLVLLIIFMIAAPLSTVDIPVDLPASNAPATPPPEQPLSLTLNAERELSLGDRRLTLAELPQALSHASGGDTDRIIHLRADKGVDYGAVMAVMSRLQGAGYRHIALVGLETPE